MALVLKEVLRRDGSIKRFDVVRADNGTPQEVLEDIPAGEYSVMENGVVAKYNVSYRTVQDLSVVI
jgi:hypothetical protein